ncbi:DegT/DnrJ/EryC1/StrS family aminotransferase [Leptospira borgpetersenii]|uniref:DegT/DnrJ/EryC1/StrS family aminotransferase n=1 Tax=Leptospira borgpetersenii TaxID=174 RepID=UPI000297DB87|nr:DegT/DnrJ/EryC1/StrS family aminotransferase [Leptospira borgpetersenii]EMO11126.1 putative pleiotropic regulatory protein DegT [Leptospira borgpetersenii str. Noumea 25]EKQ99145.1 putative pleiotropic regulatory protein DegT [Leptospira borgpetersenii serovar Castellonis str. 200801910]KGE24526.1 pleiotropic regulatory protein DegT [Leptospira borgpetersenii serovar Ballum]MBE8159722.1 DegT/DnrJ/EryC1/StrS family aminotransferase [Leptospira borgpetersenii serovar Ballum]MBE8164256.1 DegT/
MINIPYINLVEQWKNEREELLPILDSVLGSGQYVGGQEVAKFEEDIAKFCGVKYAVALNSGTDALVCGLLELGIRPGDEVITPPNSFIASTASIVNIKAKPVFVDVGEDQNLDPEKLEKAITSKTKAIMPVHLTGRVAAMNEIMRIADKYSIPVIEDAAQSIGSKYDGKFSGSIGKVGCFSTHPLKNLNACGDGGFLTTNDEKIYNSVSRIRNHGLVDRNTVGEFGFVTRMDTVQAAILNFRLMRLPQVIEKRRQNAQLYKTLLDKKNVFIPEDKPLEFNTYHTFVIQVERRDELKDHLFSQGIETSIHYPIPIHLQPASRNLGYKQGDFPVAEKQAGRILTLPIHQYLKDVDLHKIVQVVNRFYES